MSETKIQLAQRTKSDQYHGHKVSRYDLAHWLDEAIFALSWLDKIKKSVSYGRDFENRQNITGRTLTIFDTMESLPIAVRGLTHKDAVDVIHGILGKATEAQEMLEILRDMMHNPDGFSKAKLAEEVFDSRWYDFACLIEQLGMTEDAIDAAGFAKLRVRFPGKFNSDDANVRDTKAEAVAFTGDANAAPFTPETVSFPPPGGEIATMHFELPAMMVGRRAVYTPPLPTEGEHSVRINRITQQYGAFDEDGRCFQIGQVTWEDVPADDSTLDSLDLIAAMGRSSAGS